VADLTITEAAARLGISRDAMRTRVRRGQVVAFKDPTGQWRVNLPDVQADPGLDRGHDPGQDHPPDPPPGQGAGDGAVTALEELVSVLKAQVATQQEQLTAKDRQLAERAREVEQLHILLQTSQQNEQRLLTATLPEASGGGATAEEANVPGSDGKTAPEASQRVYGASAGLRGWLSRLFGTGQ
jgi:hypothetical protein